MLVAQLIWQPCSSVRTGKRTNCGNKSAGKEIGGTKTKKLIVVNWERGKNGSLGNLLLLRGRQLAERTPRFTPHSQ